MTDVSIISVVYGEMIDDSGRHYWLRYTSPQQDPQAAATEAAQAWMGIRMRCLEVYTVDQTEQPRRFMVGAVSYYPVGTRPEPPQ